MESLPVFEVLAGGLVLSTLAGALLAVTDRRRRSHRPAVPAPQASEVAAPEARPKAA